jgi:hypothetical protein
VVEPASVVSLSTEEFGQICQRVHKHLLDRAEDAHEKCKKHPTDRSRDVQVETAKDVFVFVHLMELVEGMTKEILEHRQRLAENMVDDPSEIPELFSTAKKEYLN